MDSRLILGFVAEELHYETGKFSPDRILLFEDTGICWDVDSGKWQHLYQKAEEFFLKNGDLEISKSHCQANRNTLKNCLRKQRMIRENISAERRQKQDLIDMVF